MEFTVVEPPRFTVAGCLKKGNHRLRWFYTRWGHSKGKAKRNNTRAIKMLSNKLLSSTQNSKEKIQPCIRKGQKR